MLRIQEICRGKGVALQDLAKRLGITYQSLHASINGNPTLERIRSIADILEVPITDLFEKPEEMRFFVEYRGETHEIKKRDIIRLIEGNK